MCNFDDGFILCKCDDLESGINDQDSNSMIYVWSLYKYIGKSKSFEMGRYILPGGAVGTLTSDFVIEELNSKNCFDFEYMPQEGDNLLISSLGNIPRMEFIFRGNEWIGDNYDPFTDITEIKFEGIIKDIEQYCNYK